MPVKGDKGDTVLVVYFIICILVFKTKIMNLKRSRD